MALTFQKVNGLPSTKTADRIYFDTTTNKLWYCDTGKNLTEIAQNESYFQGTDLRSYFHTFGRAFTAKGQNFVSQALLKSGHTVAAVDVRSEDIPYIDGTYKLETKFKDLEAGSSILTGTTKSTLSDVGRVIDSSLAGILKFYDKVALTEMALTNGETYQLKDNGKVIKGFIDPTDVFNATGSSPADGYTIKLYKYVEDESGLSGKFEQIGGTEGWVVDPVNGAFTFEVGKTPADKGYGTIYADVFTYVGKYVSKDLAELYAKVGLGGSTGEDDEPTNGTLVDRIAALEAVDFSGGNGVVVSEDDKKDKTISLKLTNDTNGIALTSDGIKSVVKLVKSSNDSSTTYQLQINGTNIGDAINIEKDKYVTQGRYDAVNEEIVLTINGGSTVKIPAADLISEFTASSGISINNDATTGNRQISIKKSTSFDSDYIFVDDTGIGLSGINDSISGIASGYIDDFDVKITKYVNDSDATTLSGAKKYTDDQISSLSGTANDKFTPLSSFNNILHDIDTTDYILVSELNNNQRTISLKLSDAKGNALTGEAGTDGVNGLYVQGFECSENITFEKNEKTGFMTIKTHDPYVLSVATGDDLGGIKSGNDITVSESGEVTVNKAGSLKHSLKIGDVTFDGSTEKTITAATLGALTELSGSSSILVKGTGTERQIEVIVKSGDKYIEHSVSGIQSKGIDDAISAAVKPVSDKIGSITSGTVAENLNSLKSLIDTEEGNRIEAVSGLSDRIASLETEIGSAEGGENSLSERVSTLETGLENEISARIADVDALSAAITGEVSTRTTAINDLDLRIGTLESTIGIADNENRIELLESNLEDEISARIADVDALSAAITGEVSTRATAVSTLTNILNGYSTEGSVSAAIKAVDDRITTVKQEAIDIAAGSGIIFGEDGSKQVINVRLADNDGILSHTENGISSTISIKKVATETGFAATYHLVGKNGQQLGESINIIKDQFLEDVKYISSAEGDIDDDNGKTIVDAGTPYIEFTVNIGGETSKKLYVPVEDLVDTYSAGNGISISDSNSSDGMIINIDLHKDCEDFLKVDVDGLKLSGVNKAITGAIADLSGTVSGEIVDLSGTLSGKIDEILTGNIANLSDDLSNEISERIEAVSGLSDRITSLETEIGGGSAGGGKSLKDRVSTLETDLDEAEKSIESLNDLIGDLSGTGTSTTTVIDYIGEVVTAQGLINNNKLDNSNITTPGQVVIAGDNKTVKTTGIAVGGPTLSNDPNANTLATEAAVKAFIEKAISDALCWTELK